LDVHFAEYYIIGREYTILLVESILYYWSRVYYIIGREYTILLVEHMFALNTGKSVYSEHYNMPLKF